LVVDRPGDALAHVAGAAAALRRLAAGPEDVGWTAGARSDGGVDFPFTNRLANTDEHALAPGPHADATYSQERQDTRLSPVGQAGAKSLPAHSFPAFPAAPRRSGGVSCP